MKNLLFLLILLVPTFTFSQLVTCSELLVKVDTVEKYYGNFFCHVTSEKILLSIDRRSDGSNIIEEYLIVDTLSIDSSLCGETTVTCRGMWLPKEFNLTQIFKLTYDTNKKLYKVCLVSEIDESKITLID